MCVYKSLLNYFTNCPTGLLVFLLLVVDICVLRMLIFPPYLLHKYISSFAYYFSCHFCHACILHVGFMQLNVLIFFFMASEFCVLFTTLYVILLVCKWKHIPLHLFFFFFSFNNTCWNNKTTNHVFPHVFFYVRSNLLAYCLFSLQLVVVITS